MQSVASLSGVCILQECYAAPPAFTSTTTPTFTSITTPCRTNRTSNLNVNVNVNLPYTSLLINRLRLLFTCWSKKRKIFVCALKMKLHIMDFHDKSQPPVTPLDMGSTSSTLAPEPDSERQGRHNEHHSQNGDVVRDIIIGFADGLTVPFALTAGLSSYVLSLPLLFVFGIDRY
jgi:hypothetical protein